MDVSVDAPSCNLPELLARDLAESENIFLARSRTAGPPAMTLAFEAPPPHVPQRKPSCVATPRLHRTTSDIDLCSLGQDSAAFVGRYEEDKNIHIDAAVPLGALRTLRRTNAAGVRNFHLKMENDKDERRMFLNSFDEEWGSDSSAEIETGMSSPSVRLRQQSITTAATSVDVQSVAGGRGTGSERLISEEPHINHAPAFQSACESWVNLDTRGSDSEVETDRNVPVRSWVVGSLARLYCPSPTEPSEFLGPEIGQKGVVSVPQRRSSLSHQVTTVTLSDTVPAVQPAPYKPTPELSTRLLQLSSDNLSRSFLTSDPRDEWNTSEPASSPVVRSSRRQPSPACHFHRDLIATPFDQLPPSPAPSAPEQYCDTSQNISHIQQSQQSSVANPRKSNSISRMPFLSQVNSWREAGGQRRCPANTPTSPISVAPIANIRVSTEIFENLRIMVTSFPDTMLSTDCLTVQTIRNYARKLRIGDVKKERVSPRPSDELSIAKSPTSPDVTSQALDRKSSFGNLKLMTSLRGKFTSRFTSTPMSTFPHENSEEPWPPVDNCSPSIRCNSSPSRPSGKPGKCPYITALRSIFPTGTDYLLDALYAHIIVYNYINSLCGGFPHLHLNGADPHLRSRPSTNFVVPAGVTSLADLQLQEDAGESTIGDFYKEVAEGSSNTVVPSKAAAMLGLGSTNMGQPLRPAPGTLGGRSARLRKTTPPGASFAASLESDATLRYLRDNISRNIHRLVETVKSSYMATLGQEASQEDEDGCIMGPFGKELEPTLMRAMCEVVRCYEELNA